MQELTQAPNLDNLASLIKIIRQRQQLYFSLLSFISKNIESSSSKMDQIGLFSRFLVEIKASEQSVLEQQQNLYAFFRLTTQQQVPQNFHIRRNHKYPFPNNRQISRLVLRIIELLESSLQRSSCSMFSFGKKLSVEFFRFKNVLHRITTVEVLNVKNFVTTVVSYTRNKFNRQLRRVQKYLTKLESGQEITLRDYFNKEESAESCREQQSKQIFKCDKINSNIMSHQKKQSHSIKITVTDHSLKKRPPTRQSLLKRKPPKSSCTKSERQETAPTPNQKSKTAQKLLKFYHLLELNKKQFLQDYIFDQQEKQSTQQFLLNQLLERNKTIKQQINSYCDKGERYLKTIAEKTDFSFNLNKNSTDDECENKNIIDKNESINEFKLSAKRSFVISKRRSSLNLQNGFSPYKSDNEMNVAYLPQTTKHLTSSNKASNSITKSPNKRNRMFIVKAPKLFEEEIIPEQHVVNSVRKNVSIRQKNNHRKNQHLRMRRRNNGNHFQKNPLVQSFNYDSDLLQK